MSERKRMQHHQSEDRTCEPRCVSSRTNSVRKVALSLRERKAEASLICHERDASSGTALKAIRLTSRGTRGLLGKSPSANASRLAWIVVLAMGCDCASPTVVQQPADLAPVSRLLELI